MSNQRSWILKIIGAVSIATISTIAVIYISHKILRKFYLKHDPWKQIHATFNRNVYKKTFQSGVVRAYETNSYEGMLTHMNFIISQIFKLLFIISMN